MTCSSLSSDGKSSGSSGYSCSGFLIVVILYVLTTAVFPFLSSCSDCSVSLSDKTYSINKNDISTAIDVSESSFEEDVIN